MARMQVGRYHAVRLARLSTLKKPKSSRPPATRAIRPWREAIFAGAAVAAAISLGAWLVYARACDEKISDVRHHLAELAARLASLSSDAHLAVKNLAYAQRAPAAAAQNQRFSFVRDNSEEVRRIYSFGLEDTEKSTLLDSGEPQDKPGSHPLPAHALKARKYYQTHHNQNDNPIWTVTDGMEITAFSLIQDERKQAQGAFAIEADVGRIEVKIASIRQAFLLTCLFGSIAGAISGAVVWRIRTRSALVQAEIEQNRRLEEAIIMSLGEAVYVFDPQTERYRWRGNLSPLLGFTPNEASETRVAWMERLHPDDRGRYTDSLARALEEACAMQVEYRVRRGDGSWIWVLDRNHPTRLDDGRLQLAGSLIDLTSRHAAEETLRLFFDEAATAHFAFDGDTIVDANPAAIALFGAPDKETLLAQPVWALWPRRQPTQSLSAEGWADYVMAALSVGTSHFEWQFIRIDGSPVDCDVFLRHALFQGRDVLMMACYDISTVKRAQTQLITSEQRFRDVSEAIGEFIWEVDREGRYTYASRRVVEVLGREADAVMGRTPFEFVPAEDLASITGQLESIFRSGLAFRNFEHRVRRSDGSLLWISSSGVPMYDSSGAVSGYRGASLDITKHRAYEQELVLQKEAAETAGRAKSNFLAMMSHEIRTPLNSVLGFADLVLNTRLDPTQHDYLQTIKSSGDALLVLLNDILDFSKIESGRMEVEIRPIDLQQCIREVMSLYEPNAKAKKLTISADVAEDLPQHILTDGSRLRQILVNLVGNAVKFTSDGGIRISTSIQPDAEGTPGRRIRITVSDTGIGISADQRERLFEPFTQADSSTTRRFGGTGLGLAISRRLALLLDGQLGLAEHDGPGSAFYLELPALVPTSEQVEVRRGKPEPEFFPLLNDEHFAGNPPIVLVVDDNTLNRRLTSQLLKNLGARTDTAASAEECFQKIAIQKFDLVLMDVQMPKMDGLEATRIIRSRESGATSSLVIVALTADAMVGDRERCLEAGMNDYLTKPLRREALAQVLHTYSRGSRA